MSNKEYADWIDYPMSKWRWESFSPREMRSKGDGKLMIDAPSMDKLQALRVLLDKPLYLTSAYRSVAHNKRVGGAKNSQHLLAKAFDVQMHNQDPAEFLSAAVAVGFTGIGFYQESGFIHIDTGPPRTWNQRWFKVHEVQAAAAIDKVAATEVSWWQVVLAWLFGGKK